jgi:hypothetical protein
MTDEHTPEPEEEPSAFIRWLREHLDGETLDELDEGIKEIAAAADISGRKTSLTLAIDIDKKGRTLVVKADVKAKIPPPPRDADVFYPDRDGGLFREDPTRPKLDFTNVVQLANDDPRRVDTSTGEFKTLDQQTGESQ